MIKKDAAWGRVNFEQCEIIREIPLQGEKAMPYFQITRDGFAMLAMGFTGDKAFAFKIRYIKAFNRMEAKLQQLAVKQACLQSYCTPQGLELVKTSPYRLGLAPKVISLRAQGFTQEQIARQARISPRTVRRIEHDARRLNLVFNQ